MNIINLKLNKDGILAFKTDKKVLYTEVDADLICNNLIAMMFPLSLVESWTVEKSWFDRIGEKVAVVTGTGERYLGEIVRKDYGNTVLVKYNTFEDSYNCFVTVHANGVEVTHCKKKIHIEEISAEEVERFEKMMKNIPFTNVLKMLDDENGAIKFDPAELEFPEWMNIETIKAVENLLKKHKSYFYYGANDDENNEENF